MQIKVTIPDDLAANLRALGFTPEAYVEELVAHQALTGAPVSAAESVSRLADLELFFDEMALPSSHIPILPDEALTRESFYQDHD